MAKRKRAFNKKDNNTIQFNEYVQRKQNVNLIPRSVNQEEYIDHLLNPEKLMIFAIGPAGSGKTMLAVMAAIKAYKEGKIDKIIITRPAVGVDDEKHGFLPGDLNAKMEPWTKPIFDVMEEYWSPKTVKQYIDEGVIEISPLAFMRGRTFKNAFIIADEMQLVSQNQMKMLLTRIGEGSQMVLTGDLTQNDKLENNGLQDFLTRLASSNTNMVTAVSMDDSDVQRHPVIKEILKMYDGKS